MNLLDLKYRYKNNEKAIAKEVHSQQSMVDSSCRPSTIDHRPSTKHNLEPCILITITPHTGVNEFIFGTTKANDDPIFSDGFKLEYSKKRLVAISFTDTFEFLVDGERANLTYDSDWLSQQNPYLDGENYIFPEINIAVRGIAKDSKGNEITVYSDEIKHLYERGLSNCIRYNELRSTSFKIDDVLVVDSYKGFDKMLFGESSEAIIQKVGKPKKIAGNKTKSTLYWDNMILSFKEDKLIQVILEDPLNIILNNENIAASGNYADQFNATEKFVNRAYTILFDFGIAFSGYADDGPGPKTIIVFDTSLKEFWSNTKRPLLL